MNKIIITMLLAFSIVGCDIPRAQFTHSTYHDVEIVGFDPPKHVYVDLRVVATGEIYKRVYVSKHCNSWRRNANVGRTFKARIDHYRTEYEDNLVKNTWGWSNRVLNAELCK